MKQSDIKRIIQEELQKFLVETGEPDQDYDWAPYDAIVDEIKYLGYDADHREFDKYQGIRIDIEGVGRFWFDNVSYHGDDMVFTIFPEDDSDMKFKGSVYKSTDDEWIANFGPEFKEYLDSLKTDEGHQAKQGRRQERNSKQEEDGRRQAEDYEKKRPKLHNEHLSGKHLVITTPYGDTYEVDENGRITKGDMEPSGEWLFIGIGAVNSNRIDLRFNDITPEILNGMKFTYKNGNPKYTVIDWDHGSHRRWSNTKYHGIKSIYIEQ